MNYIIMDVLKYSNGKFLINDTDIDDNIMTNSDVIADVSAKIEQFGIIDSPEFIEVTLDSDNKVLECTTVDGLKYIYQDVCVCNIDAQSVTCDSISTDSLNLSTVGLTEFEQALKEHGFSSGAGDWSDATTLEIPMPRCAYVNIYNDDNTAVWPTTKTNNYQYWMQFNDMQGNMFKKRIIFNAQGTSSMKFIKKNGAVDICNDEWIGDDTFSLKIGDWVPQDSFHLKCFYTDFFKGVSLISYQIANEIELDHDELINRPWKRALLSNYTFGSNQASSAQIDDLTLQFDNEARCMPDGFPCIVYLNEEFYGIYIWCIKKHRDNYHMEKDVVTHIHLDDVIGSSTIFSANGDSSKIGWNPNSGFEIRNPKSDYYVTASGTEYNPDATTSQELAGVNTLSETVQDWISGTVYSALDRVVVGEHMYLSRVDNNTADPTEANYKKPSKVWDSATEYWIEITFTNKVKKHILNLSTYTAQIKALSTTEEKKALFEQYFDVTGFIDYEIVQLATGDTDGFNKNWQWITYDGIKWFVCEYDKDMSFGGFWTGMYTQSAPDSGTWMGYDTNTPMGLCISLYADEIKARWQELYNSGIIGYDNFINKFIDLTHRIGTVNYEREYEKWPESPCNRDNGLNSDWSISYTYVESAWNASMSYTLNTYVIKENQVYKSLTSNNVGNDPESDSGTNWENVTYITGKTYSKGNVCFYGTNGHFINFTANVTTQSPPLDTFYTSYPEFLGYHDSLWRVKSFINQRLSVVNEWINSL